MKVNELVYKDPILVLRFLAQLKKACDSNGVFKGMVLFVLTKYMKDAPASSLKVEITPHKDDETTYRLPKTGEEQVFTYVEAMPFFLNSYATESNIAKAKTNIAYLKRALT